MRKITAKHRRSGWSTGFGRTTFPADMILISRARVVTLVCIIYARSYIMQTRQWHLFLVLVLGLPFKFHTSQGLFLSQIGRLDATIALPHPYKYCGNILSTDRSALCTSAEMQSTSGHHLLWCTMMVGRTTFSVPLPPLGSIHVCRAQEGFYILQPIKLLSVLASETVSN